MPVAQDSGFLRKGMRNLTHGIGGWWVTLARAGAPSLWQASVGSHLSTGAFVMGVAIQLASGSWSPGFRSFTRCAFTHTTPILRALFPESPAPRGHLFPSCSNLLPQELILPGPVWSSLSNWWLHTLEGISFLCLLFPCEMEVRQNSTKKLRHLGMYRSPSPKVRNFRTGSEGCFQGQDTFPRGLETWL